MSRKGVRIGILALQGDIYENHAAVSRAMKIPQGFADDSIIRVKTAQDISALDGLVIPGGESTAIDRLASRDNIMDAIRSRITDDHMPVLGICAGLILLASTAADSKPNRQFLGALDIGIRRNAFGRQRQSFETRLEIKPLALSDFRGVFIRAPLIYDTGPDVEILCELPAESATTPDRRIVAVRRDNIIGTAFHPELSGDHSIHKHFVDMARRYHN